MITQCGIRCDVCDNYILMEAGHFFRCNGAENLTCHDKCKEIVLTAQSKNDWKLLPDGALKRGFQEAESKLNKEV